MPRGSTAVENTICVSVVPKRFCNCPMKPSSSMVERNATFISMENLPVTQLHSITFGQVLMNW